MENLRVVRPSLHLSESLLDYQKIMKIKTIENIEEHINNLNFAFTHYNCSPYWVPCETYWLINNKNEIIGLCEIRKNLIDDRLFKLGNINIEIRKDLRNKGYGRKLFSMAVDRFIDMRFKELVIVCNSDNKPIIKIIESYKNIILKQSKSDYNIYKMKVNKMNNKFNSLEWYREFTQIIN